MSTDEGKPNFTGLRNGEGATPYLAPRTHIVKVMHLDGTFVGYLTDGGQMRRQKSHKDVIVMSENRAERQAWLIDQYGKFKAEAVKK